MAKNLNVNYHESPDIILNASLRIISRDFENGLITLDDKAILEKYRIKLLSSSSSPFHALTTIEALLIAHRYINCSSFIEATDDDSLMRNDMTYLNEIFT